MVGRQLDNSMAVLNSFHLSDDIRYRPVLDMDSIPESYRKAGYGGVDRYSDLAGFINSNLLISYRSRIDVISNMANVQKESFKAISERALEWRIEMDHQPMISPVDVKYRLGDGFRFREIHPVLGTPRIHYGQDFSVPYATEVYATGNGTVIESGWNSMGFGNFIIIDHGYGLRSTYGHLSQINVSRGMNVKRGDLIGLSGNTGTSSGPHLHYQIDQFGQHKNPINFFNDDMTVEEYNEMIQVLASRTRFR
jgi:murein DD-endopeptidase MepM/ murein hydrolase activator NlpD